MTLGWGGVGWGLIDDGATRARFADLLMGSNFGWIAPCGPRRYFGPPVASVSSTNHFQKLSLNPPRQRFTIGSGLGLLSLIWGGVHCKVTPASPRIPRDTKQPSAAWQRSWCCWRRRSAMSLPGFFPSAVVVYAVLKQVSKLPVRYAICGTDRALHYQSKNVSALAQLGSIGQQFLALTSSGCYQHSTELMEGVCMAPLPDSLVPTLTCSLAPTRLAISVAVMQFICPLDSLAFILLNVQQEGRGKRRGGRGERAKRGTLGTGGGHWGQRTYKRKGSQGGRVVSGGYEREMETEAERSKTLVHAFHTSIGGTLSLCPGSAARP
eukprot:3941886-Rhodomonas_salina.1